MFVVLCKNTAKLAEWDTPIQVFDYREDAEEFLKLCYGFVDDPMIRKDYVIEELEGV